MEFTPWRKGVRFCKQKACILLRRRAYMREYFPRWKKAHPDYMKNYLKKWKLKHPGYHKWWHRSRALKRSQQNFPTK